MIPNHTIQADVLADLLAYAALTSLLNSAGEVREDQYQGTVFGYPAVRVAILNQTPIIGPEQCDLASLVLSVRCFAEEASSKMADTLAGLANDRLHRRNFFGTGWMSWLRSAGLIGALRVDERLWRSEAIITGTVYPTVGVFA
jgi:hypothetical protein